MRIGVRVKLGLRVATVVVAGLLISSEGKVVMLEWMCKRKVVNHHNEVPFHVLERKWSFGMPAALTQRTQSSQSDAKNFEPCRGVEGVDDRRMEGRETRPEHPPHDENMIIHGDNLLALKSLLPRYEGKVKCIYIDLPYNTGNEGWCYNDNVNDTVHLHGILEAKAKEEYMGGTRSVASADGTEAVPPVGNRHYVRPIVLFQAQSNVSEDSETFDKIKRKLVGMGIHENEIAIKTSQKDEIGSTKMMSPKCTIRYVITVNALKEGWDCPFAYILASLANKTSKVDVEQVVGRILRQPYARKHVAKLLNMSYVLASSNDFNTQQTFILAERTTT